MKFKIIIACILLCSLNSCYRMPTEDDYSLLPNVNNPDITREKAKNPFAPAARF